MRAQTDSWRMGGESWGKSIYYLQVEKNVKRAQMRL
jgi:hypothetical protein